MSENMSIINDSGRVNMNGLDINIADVIGDKIVNQWMATLTDEDMQVFFKEMNDLAFRTSKEYIDGEYKDIKLVKKVQQANGSYYSKSEDTPLWREMQKIFIRKFQEKIEEECNRILATDEYIEKAIKISEEIIDYALNGYKEDMKARIRERLVGNVLHEYPTYQSIDLRSVIHEELEKTIHYNNNY